MGNYKPIVLMMFFVALVSNSCSKVNLAAATGGTGQKMSSINAISESITFNNVTIDAAETHVFSVPDITQSVIDKGSVSVYATFTSESQWSALPIIKSCDSRLEIGSITAGNVEIQNNLGSAVSMSFRFDIVAN
ncbi:MAG TPA: hypothetical protein VKR53_01765 [Puia sp.]|nr:hypothetical protein [Puia sp.]